MSASPRWHLAQLNIGRVRAPMTDSLMAGFVAELEPVNALADSAPGFVWRLQTEAGDATAIRPYDDDTILINMSVWETVEALKAFVYRTHHADVMRNASNGSNGSTRISSCSGGYPRGLFQPFWRRSSGLIISATTASPLTLSRSRKSFHRPWNRRRLSRLQATRPILYKPLAYFAFRSTDKHYAIAN